LSDSRTTSDARITIAKNGPLKVEVDGSLELIDHEGSPVPHREGRAVYLCRCGGSERKPFCDGTHSRIGFAGAEAAVEALKEADGE
jgi:CDGSH-type Zn-finger protein